MVGEAFNRAMQADPSLMSGLPEASRIIDFRNRLARGYDDVSPELVWSYAAANLPVLVDTVRRFVAERGDR